MNKNILMTSICALSCVGIASVVIINNKNYNNNTQVNTNITENNTNDKVKLDFSASESKEMRKFYTLEGQEFIKKILPESISSDFALFNVGKSLDNELKDIKFTTINNKEISLKDLKGKKIFIDFALTTCGTCINELNFISSHNFKDDNIEYIHVFPRDTTANIKKLYKDSKLKLKEDSIVSETGLNGFEIGDLNITNVPAKIFIDENGIVQYAVVSGVNDKETLDLHLERAFDPSVPKILDYLKTTEEYEKTKDEEVDTEEINTEDNEDENK